MGTLEVFWGHPQGNVLLQASIEIMCSQMGAGSCPSVREDFSQIEEGSSLISGKLRYAQLALNYCKLPLV